MACPGRQASEAEFLGRSAAIADSSSPCHLPNCPHVVNGSRGMLLRDPLAWRERSVMWKLGRLLSVFRKELRLAWAVLRDPRAPKAAKLATVLAALYVVSPVDFVSDFIPVLGWLDDGVIAFLLLQLAFKFLPPELLATLRARVAQRSPGKATP